MEANADRTLRNLVWGGDPITRLKAVHELRGKADAWFESAVVELVVAARTRRAPGGRLSPFTWEEVGTAIGLSGQQASRKYRKAVSDRL
jgi:hypothetical protein